MDPIIYQSIGIIHTPFEDTSGVPIQPPAAEGVAGTVEVDERFANGLKDIEGFSHIILIYHCHLSKEPRLRIKPFLDDTVRGVFATRAPTRPNSIGLSVVRLIKVEGHILHVDNVDIVDGTPLLDIKPYVPEFDCNDDVSIGWLSDRVGKLPETRSDKRFRK
ncbi:MAG: tRNA (N6-threonylcarbamoyladenosine(37)-N6)-methyltransferase TrmO [Thermodesulfobacteriota bacterium]|nr:tRNA (N6-threonylcarbamoyladenosine(37)-N6)-methyltransferase TrmO [Thermodesulfobacteriota bacterium]